MHADVAAVIVAAGASRRLGEPKQLLPWRGTTLVGYAVAEAAAVCGRVIVVTGAAGEAVDNALAGSTAKRVANPDWASGMGSSVAAGVRHAEAAGAAAVLLMTCDQPLLGRAELAALLALWQNARSCPAAALYHGAPGVPVVFPAAWFGRLTALRGDRGARMLLRGADGKPPRAVRTLEMPRAATDIDTPAELAALRRDQPDTDTSS